MNYNLDKVIKASPIQIHKGRFAYLKCKNEQNIKNFFFISKDKDEITVVTEEKNIKDVKYDKDVKWFKLFEIKISVPFEAPGFLAKISKTIADKGLNILAVSTFSKDYVLIREEDQQIAIEALKNIGFAVSIKSD